jgi:very-short-patch-repair endonuclease
MTTGRVRRVTVARSAGRTAATLAWALWRAYGLPEPIPEHRFHPVRKWRFDYAWPDRKVALEIQGGLFVQGRHSRGAALVKEFEKLNTAAAMGWRVLFVTPKQMANGEAAQIAAAALKGEA